MVGVGSVGTRAWVVLIVGNDGDDPLFLQIKEAEASVLEPFLGKSKFANHGQRVVEGQRLMQAASDIMLGWFRTPGIDGVTRDFYIRQLWDGKASALIETMSPRGLRVYAEICAWTLARAHARSGDPSPSPPTSAEDRSTGPGLVRRDLRRSERTRLRRPPRRRRLGTHHGASTARTQGRLRASRSQALSGRSTSV